MKPEVSFGAAARETALARVGPYERLAIEPLPRFGEAFKVTRTPECEKRIGKNNREV